MSKKANSQSQQSVFENMAFGGDQLERWTREGLARTEAVVEQIARFETAAAERAKAGLTDMHRLFMDSVDYGVKLSEQWRSMMLDSLHNVSPKTGTGSETSKAA